MNIEIPYYQDNSRISNSAIGWYNKRGPKYLRSMLDGKEEGLKGSFLEKGTMIHMYLLQPEEFWDNYIVLNYETPSSPQQKKFADAYVNSIEIEPNLKAIDAFKASYSVTGKKDADILAKGLEIADSLSDYITFLQTSNGSKKVISFSDLAMLKNIKKNVSEHCSANEMLLTESQLYESHNEFHINWEDAVPCKSLIDRVRFDHTNKKVVLIDIKTTADVFNFKHSVDEYDYYRQIAFYLKAIRWYLINELKVDASAYTFAAYIVAIQSNSDNQVRVFNMLNEEEILKADKFIEQTINNIHYHSIMNQWDHTREYYENEGIELLN